MFLKEEDNDDNNRWQHVVNESTWTKLQTFVAVRSPPFGTHQLLTWIYVELTELLLAFPAELWYMSSKQGKYFVAKEEEETKNRNFEGVVVFAWMARQHTGLRGWLWKRPKSPPLLRSKPAPSSSVPFPLVARVQNPNCSRSNTHLHDSIQTNHAPSKPIDRSISSILASLSRRD